jgi:hypothetical protein
MSSATIDFEANPFAGLSTTHRFECSNAFGQLWRGLAVTASAARIAIRSVQRV